MYHHPSPAAASDAPKRRAAAAAAGNGGSKKRGSYNCGRCGLPKKGHVCLSTGSPVIAAASPPPTPSEMGVYVPLVDVPAADDEVGDEMDGDLAGGVLPGRLLVEVLRRLPPKELMAAAGVCKGWKECVGRVWRAAEELRIRVPRRSQVGFVGSVLQKCGSLVRLSLRMESDFNATDLACVAFSCPNLEAMEITIHDGAVNRIVGDALGRFVAEKRSLTSLKIEGCSNLGFLNLCSSSLLVLWLSDLHCLSKSVISCPNLNEISLDFGRQDNDSTDLAAMLDSLGRTCPKLRNVHIASTRLSNSAVLALTGAKLRDLRMLSLVLGSKITDAAVASIVSSYTDLELLDLSGSNISDSGIGMICNVYPDTLSRLLLALCPNITSSGIQFATAQLPLLQLIDCGMSMRDVASQSDAPQENLLHDDAAEDPRSCERPTRKLQPMYQKLIIKHGQLRKLSLWGCSALDALHLNCPELTDLNLNSCTNLHPERLLLQCPKLEMVSASGCQNFLIGAVHDQILTGLPNEVSHLPSKRLGDGSKRVQAPQFLVQQQASGEKQASPRSRCTLLVD
ncbi:unnamed protein product [Spirodela intermedia]|uniref:F-box domain-containing protein n=1 Tax=Spirodela intermedia TaxID=51605 RepID=A0A7I8JCP5_SPIIN|nr:unnamed protein product [Spirodela intermedia]CAA6667273.1 unnamed protein product [Spirodela intermedia]